MDTELGFVYTETGIVYKSNPFPKQKMLNPLKNDFTNDYKSAFGW